MFAKEKINPAAQLLLITAPWVNPVVFGPSPGLVSLLVSWFVVGVLILMKPEPGAKACFGAWLIAALLSSSFALFQYFGVASYLSPLVNQIGPGEAFANLRQRNQFASLTNIGMLALLWFVAFERKQSSVQKHWMFVALAGLLAAANAASASRTGLIQLGLLIGMAWVWGWLAQPGPQRQMVSTALVAYVVASLTLPFVAGLDPATSGMLGRLHEGTPACASRWVLWSNVLTLIAQKPWFGWGWGELDYAHYVTLYPDGRFCDILDNAHNLPLHLAVELGIPFALLACAMAGWLIWRAAPWREVDLTRQMAWGVLAVIMLHSMLEYPLWYGPFQVAFGLCVYLLWPVGQMRGVASGLTVHKQLRKAVVGVLLASLAYAAWDYHRVSQIYLAPQARDASYRDETLEKISKSWLFKDQVKFAELTTTPLNRANAEWTLQIAGELLHFSPEPRVIEKVIESAVMLGRDDEAMFHLIRYRIAFPAEHASWRGLNGLTERPDN